MKFTKLALLLTLTWGCAAVNAQQAPATAPDAVALPTPSSTAQKLYSAAKADLLQVRSLLKTGRTQSSVGSVSWSAPPTWC